MANANISLIVTTNTFDEWRIAHNNITNSVNELRNATYVKDEGSIFLSNGSLVISGTLATLLSVSGNASISQRLTSSNVVSGTLLITGPQDSASFTSPNVLVYVANTVFSKNLMSNNITTLNVLNVSGNTNFSHANVLFSDPAVTVNVANVLTTQDLIVRANAYVGILTSNNAILGNVTVLGSFVTEGASYTSDASIYVRYGAVVDGTGQFVVVRGPSSGNAELRFDHTTGRWKASANSANANGWLIIGATEGDQNYANSQLMNATLRAYREYLTNTTITGNTTIDLGLSNYYRLRLAANANLTFSNAALAGNVSTVTLVLVQSANGGNVVTFTNTVNWSDSQTPVLTTTANKLDVLQIVTMDGGVRFIGGQSFANVSI